MQAYILGIVFHKHSLWFLNLSDVSEILKLKYAPPKAIGLNFVTTERSDNICLLPVRSLMSYRSSIGSLIFS